MKNNRRRVIFPQHHLIAAKGKQADRNTIPTRNAIYNMADDQIPFADYHLINPPLLRDSFVTPSSNLQDATLAECLPLLNGLNDPSENPFDYDERGLKQLDRESHIAFIEDKLAPLPAPYVATDASRPWLIYWALTALFFLGEDVSKYRHRVVKTLFPLQNPSGGYGGGQGHYSHLAGTYATILSLALVGGAEAYQLTDRHAMWTWLGRLKQVDGGFQICEDGEEDTRAAYCALLTIALLDLPWTLPTDSPARAAGLETFGDGLGEYISRCQTYEGGISSEPGSEAHGAYAFCALAALCLLDAPHISIPKYLNVDSFLLWLSSRQYAPEGGFAGRTNKVVDGCYSHWLGDCFPLIQAALSGPVDSETEPNVGDLYSTEGLGRYILNCCQDPDGGLCDKPSKGPDSYHTCYTLAGLSTGEHYHYYAPSKTCHSQNGTRSDAHFESAFTWKTVRNQDCRQETTHAAPGEQQEDSPDSRGNQALSKFHTGCGLNAVHPVFVIPHEAVLTMREWSSQQQKLD